MSVLEIQAKNAALFHYRLAVLMACLILLSWAWFPARLHAAVSELAEKKENVAEVGLDFGQVRAKRIKPGQEFTIPVFIDSGSHPLGAYTIWLLFDPKILNVVSITGGNAQGFTENPVTDPRKFRAGDLLFDGSNTASLTAPTGKSVVAMLRWKAIGIGSSTVTVSAANLSDTDGRKLASHGSSGTVKVATSSQH